MSKYKLNTCMLTLLPTSEACSGAMWLGYLTVYLSTSDAFSGAMQLAILPVNCLRLKLIPGQYG